MAKSRKEELRKLRKEDPESFEQLIKALKEQLEEDGYEIEVEILYDN